MSKGCNAKSGFRFVEEHERDANRTAGKCENVLIQLRLHLTALIEQLFSVSVELRDALRVIRLGHLSSPRFWFEPNLHIGPTSSATALTCAAFSADAAGACPNDFVAAADRTGDAH